MNPRATGLASLGMPPNWAIMSLFKIAEPRPPPKLGAITSSVLATKVSFLPFPVGKFFSTLAFAPREAPPSRA